MNTQKVLKIVMDIKTEYFNHLGEILEDHTTRLKFFNHKFLQVNFLTSISLEKYD